MSGPVGCGLCGIESLEQARRAPLRVASRATFDARDLLAAMQALAPRQLLNQQTRSVHAAAFWHPSTGIGPVREDVGRHNALDKLAGAIVARWLVGFRGAVLLTSRVSVEMVQKAAMIGAPVVIAVSAPTTLAIQTAEQAGITLLAIARDDGYGVFTHRIASSCRETRRAAPAADPDEIAQMALEATSSGPHGQRAGERLCAGAIAPRRMSPEHVRRLY